MLKPLFFIIFLLSLLSCMSQRVQPSSESDNKKPSIQEDRNSADEFVIVDCLLPGKLVRIGAVTYMTPRSPVKTDTLDCELKGGEYVVHDRTSYGELLNVWLPAAEAGDSEAQYYVGEIYEKGLGLPKPNYKQAVKWYLLAAEQGLSKSQINLGALYEKGLGVEQNKQKALYWYRLASGMVEDSDYLYFGSSIDQLKTQLDEREQEIKSLKTSEKRLKNLLFAKKKELDTLKSDNENDHESKQALRQDIAKLTSQITELQSTVSNYQNEKTLLAAAPPMIELVTPAVNLTRSDGTPRVTLQGQHKIQDVVGKVFSSSGLEYVVVNGVSSDVTETDDYSIFLASVPLEGEKNLITVEAKDTRGAVSHVEFQVHMDVPAGASEQHGVAKPTYEDVQFGQYHALVIGNNDYQYLSDLKTATHDAEQISTLLKERYGFQVTYLANANRSEIVSALNEYKNRLNYQDNLLIYYAGHGDLDSINERGYWLPVDAKKKDNTSWISNTFLTDILNIMQAKHVMVISDSCYSGTLSSLSMVQPDSQIPENIKLEWLKNMTQIKARMVLTSGGLSPVLDGGGGKYSIFASSLIKALTINDQVMEGNSLYRSIYHDVVKKSKTLGQVQKPDYSPIEFAGHEAGEFFFVPNK